MANYASSVRRIRRSEKSRQRNCHYKSMLKSKIKDVLSSKSKEDAEKILPRISSLLDKLASKRIIHRNKAANQKSRLTIFVNNL